MPDPLSDLGRSFPQQAPNLCHMAQLRAVVEALPFSEFHEPAACMAKHADGLRLARLDADYLRAWCRHMALGSRVRMRSLEESIISSLVSHSALPATALLRSHLEAAALAACAISEVTAAAKSGDFDNLEPLVRGSLFGTDLRPASRERFGSALPLKDSDCDPVDVAQILTSLDKFIWAQSSNGGVQRDHALFSDAVHPHHRSIKGFMKADARPDGWRIAYGFQESLAAEVVGMVVESLLRSMQHGYAASEMLGTCDFRSTPEGIAYLPPADSEMLRIWTKILQRPAPGSEPVTAC